MLTGGGVHRESGFLQLGLKMFGRHEFESAIFGCREEDLERLKFCVEAPTLQLFENPFGIILVVLRSNVVGPGGEAPYVIAHVLRLWNCGVFGLPVALSA